MEFLEQFNGRYSTLQLPLQQPPSLSSGITGPKVGISSLNGSVTLRAGPLNTLGGCGRDSSRAGLKFSGMKVFPILALCSLGTHHNSYCAFLSPYPPVKCCSLTAPVFPQCFARWVPQPDRSLQCPVWLFAGDLQPCLWH